MRRDRLGRLLGAGHRRRIAASLALLVAVAVVVAIVLATRSSTSPGADSANSQASGATSVQRRNLVATDTESGTLSYASPQTVYNRLSGTMTWLPSVGQVIQPGQALFRVDGQPVILMSGSTPAYRDLNGSDSPGPDILELNRNLVALGFNPDGIIVDDVWQPATTDAVEVFQESLGESPTGSLSLGRVVFLPGAQVVSTVEGTLGSAASDHSPGSAPEFVSLTKTSPSTSTTTTPGTSPKPKSSKHASTSNSANNLSLEALIALLKAEIAELKAAKGPSTGSPSHGGSPSSHNGSPSSGSGKPSSGSGKPSSGSGKPSSDSGSPSSGSGSPSGGGGGGGATPVLETASTQLVATVDLDPSKQSEAKIGEKVSVEMPAGNTVNGTITAVSPVAQNSSNNGNNGNNGNGNNGNGNNGNGNNGNGSGATIPVTVALSGHQSGAGLDQASVSVNFVQSEANNVLSVPVTALLATPGGGYAVQNAAAPHKLIPVTTGLFAAGYVQISGPGIYPGLQVTDSQG